MRYDEIVLVDLYLFGSDVGPLRSQRLEGISVSIGGLRFGTIIWS